jgi:hypothetical protein
VNRFQVSPGNFVLAVKEGGAGAEVVVPERDLPKWGNAVEEYIAAFERARVVRGGGWESLRRRPHDKPPLFEDPKDGDVVQVGPAGETARINVGKRNKVAVGMRFAVWQAGKGDVREEIAVIRVVGVGETTSEVSVVRQLDPERPVAKGMRVSNPLYDPHHPLTVYVHGELKSYTRDVVERHLSTYGARIAAVLDETVNVVVLREETDPKLGELMRQINAIGAIVVTEDVLARFIE